MLLQDNELLNSRYRLIEKKGSGGFSVVWLALDEKLGNARVAMKIFAPDKGLDSIGITQFEEEFELTSKLKDSRLLRITDYFIEDDSPCLVMQYCEKGSLYDLLRHKGQLTEMEIARVLYQTAGGLKYLHSQPQPIIHSDIKPDNILISYSDDYLLSDFGISNQMRSTLVRASNLKGETLAYSTPEKALNKPIGTKADIFALGITLFELAVGRVPFDDGGRALVLGLPMPDLPESFSRRFNDLIHACLVINADDRPDAGELESLANGYLDSGAWNEVPRKKQAAPAVEVEDMSRRTTPMQRTPTPEPSAASVVDSKPKEKGSTSADSLYDRSAATKKKKPIGIIIAVAAVLIIGGVLAFVFIGGGKPKETETANATPVEIKDTSNTEVLNTSTKVDPKVIETEPIAKTDVNIKPEAAKTIADASKKPNYTDKVKMSNGMIWAKYNGKYALLSADGEQVMAPTYTSVEKSNEGMWVSSGGKWGYFDKTGRKVLDPIFNNHHDFYEGLAAVEIRSKWGYIQKNGQFKVTPKYAAATDFKNGKATVQSGSKFITIDNNGECIKNCD